MQLVVTGNDMQIHIKLIETPKLKEKSNNSRQIGSIIYCAQN